MATPSIVPLKEIGDAVAGFGLGAFTLGGKGLVLIGDALDGVLDIGVRDFGDRLLDREALEVSQLQSPAPLRSQPCR